MTAIRNVGELASPYFLLEVWARREEIDIDPETFASLKRRARSLVRDARGFELRGDEPDDDWRMRRLELLALEALNERQLVLEDGTESVLGVWQDGSGDDAVVVGDLPGFADPDRRSDDAADPASTRFELALDAYRGDADWGMLLAGLEVRIYRKSSGISQQYVAMDLDTLVELDDEPTWKAFAAMFRAPAFSVDGEGVPLIRRVVDESRRHASALAADMRRDVVDAAEALIQGALDHPENAVLIGEPTRSRLHGLFEETLYVLYRVLFVLYAESRDVLPVSGLGPYATSYSIEHLVELARRGGARPDGRYFDNTLRTLFALLWDGPGASARRLGFEPIGGELFDPERTPVLGRCTIPDAAWERALNSIALGAPDSPRRRLGRRSSFAELGVDQLGSIYEGLLVLEPYLASEPAYLGVYKGDRRVFTDAQIDGFNILRHLSQGDFVLESAGGRRRGTGSFYTPHEITEYLSRAAVGPLLEPILQLAAADPQAAAQQLLALRLCDPAMGSGAFLVQAARVLALALARIRAASGDGLVTPDRVHNAKRDVVRHCLYGVDFNPLAVALAKVSLWLETLEPGRPLSFLDAHLRCGDSLIGINFATEDGDFTAAELLTFPSSAHKGLEAYLKKESGTRGVPVLARLKGRRAPTMAHQAMLPGIDRTAVESALDQLAEERQRISEMEEGVETLFDARDARDAFEALESAEDSIRNRLRYAADYWCAQWFSDGEDADLDVSGPVIPASAADFDEVVAKLVAGAPLGDRLQPQLAAATSVARRRRFFHWALEFPEVFFERGGFDAVIGNPPWSETTPSDDGFFGTFDPVVFSRGVAKQKKEARKTELRENTEVDESWRAEARRLHELSNYVRPGSDRYTWHAKDGQLRKGDANIYRQFVERAFRLLRDGGRMGQVLPDAFYVSNPATGLREKLLDDGVIDRCWVFENRKAIFPIHRSVKVVLLVAQRGGGPTVAFRAAFLTGKNASGGERAIGLEALPDVLAELDEQAPFLTASQVRALAPATLAFPELKTALDAEIVAQTSERLPRLNGDGGWGLRYCLEVGKTVDSWRFREADQLDAVGGLRVGSAYEVSNKEWWPLVSGTNFYHFEFPALGTGFRYWLSSDELHTIEGRQNLDGSSVFDHYRVVLRRVASPTNERSSISAVIPPGMAVDNSANTVWGGSREPRELLLLCAVWSSFCFDFLVRMRGATNLSYGILDGIPAPSSATLEEAGALSPAAELMCQSPLLGGLWGDAGMAGSPPVLSAGAVVMRRAQIDAFVAVSYSLSLAQYAAVLSTFPNLDRSQPMLPGEPKCFFTRDLALAAFCDVTGDAKPDIAKLMREIGSGLPDPRPELRNLEARLDAYTVLGAVAYRPTPKGGRTPTDQALVEEISDLLSEDPIGADEISDAVGADEQVVAKILKDLKKSGEVYVEGRGASARYYILGDS